MATTTIEETRTLIEHVVGRLHETEGPASTLTLEDRTSAMLTILDPSLPRFTLVLSGSAGHFLIEYRSTRVRFAQSRSEDAVLEADGVKPAPLRPAGDGYGWTKLRRVMVELDGRVPRAE